MLIEIDESKLDSMLFSVTHEIDTLREYGMTDNHQTISILLDVLDVCAPEDIKAEYKRG